MKSSIRSRPWLPPRSAFAGFRFPAEVIVVAVRWYPRSNLSYRDVEELLVERGIDVDQVTKGTRRAKRVTVRFPSSTDVRWAKVPKLRAGQEGVFLLHGADTGSGYTLLHAQDVQPPDPDHLAPRVHASRRRRQKSR